MINKMLKICSQELINLTIFNVWTISLSSAFLRTLRFPLKFNQSLIRDKLWTVPMCCYNYTQVWRAALVIS